MNSRIHQVSGRPRRPGDPSAGDFAVSLDGPVAGLNRAALSRIRRSPASRAGHARTEHWLTAWASSDGRKRGSFFPAACLPPGLGRRTPARDGRLARISPGRACGPSREPVGRSGGATERRAGRGGPLRAGGFRAGGFRAGGFRAGRHRAAGRRIRRPRRRRRSRAIMARRPARSQNATSRRLMWMSLWPAVSLRSVFTSPA